MAPKSDLSSKPASSQVQAAPMEAPSPNKALAETKSPTSSLATLTVLDEGPPQEVASKGTTLAEMALSVTRDLGGAVLDLLLGDELKPFKKELASVNSIEPEAQRLKTHSQFAMKTAELKKRLQAGESLSQIRPEAYAVAREAASQETGMRAYDCQVLGALAMDDGHIAEMRTGEGKTLTAVLPLYLNALAGKGAHLVTVNETLAKRDSEWMGPIFKKLGMTVGCVTADQSAEEKRAGYDCDVTYVSDRALGFDFLRDRGALDKADRVQRGHFFALIDEVDEVLIDEARTPMILSGQSGEASSDYRVFDGIVKDLIPGDDYKLNEENRSVWLTDGGLRFVENELVLRETQGKVAQWPLDSEEGRESRQDLHQAQLLKKAIRQENAAQKIFEDLDYHKPNPLANAVGMTGEYDKAGADKAEAVLSVARTVREQLAKTVPSLELYTESNEERVHYLDASLKAHTLYTRGDDYTVEGGEVKIVDKNKGRVSGGKRFSQGLHQALEAKEGLEIKPETRTISEITMPELVKLYERKSGMTGTGKSAEGEFLEFYGLDVVEIPTNKPVIRTDHPDVVFPTLEAKYAKVVSEAMSAAQKGRPVLIGTISVNANNRVASLLTEAGWPRDRLQILNAERVKGGEDFVDENAGRSGTISLATGERGQQIQHEPVNYKKIASQVNEAVGRGEPVLIDARSTEHAEQLEAWLGDRVDVTVSDEAMPSSLKGVQIRTKAPSSSSEQLSQDLKHLDIKDFTLEEPRHLQVNSENLNDLLSEALEAFHEGEPVVLNLSSSKLLSEAAHAFLDHGLGLGAIPMVCEGKEKENAMIELAGRGQTITVATNMAGRGANFKPDMVATSLLAEEAYIKATEGEAVTVTVDKKSEALKLKKLLGNYLPVSLEQDEKLATQKGEVVLRVGKESPETPGAVHLNDDDFQTGGLLVLGTERSSSRRIDDQLIGRSGRQGDRGDSQFYLSCEDEVPRVFGGEKLEPLLGLFGDSNDGISSDVVNGLMKKAQERVEAQHFEQRDNAGKYSKVSVAQRDSFYGLREEVLTEKLDPREFVADYAVQGLSKLVMEELGTKKTSLSAQEVDQALVDLSAKHKLDLAYPDTGSVKTDDLPEKLLPQIEKLFQNPELDSGKLRKAALRQLDAAWQGHLENMSALQDGIHLEAMAGRKPEDVFVERGYEVFENMIGQLQKQMALRLLPAATF